MKYKIYAGLSGGFGGATYQKTEDYSSMDEALEDAYALAVEEYQSYEGCHGIMSWDDCREDLIDSGFDYDDEAVDEPLSGRIRKLALILCRA